MESGASLPFNLSIFWAKTDRTGGTCDQHRLPGLDAGAPQGVQTRAHTARERCRAFKGDLIGGAKRRFRRARGIYLENSSHDNAEYHVTRNGVDQDAIVHLLRLEGFDCELIRYCSTQSSLFQWLGSVLRIENTFCVIAQKKS